MLYLCRYQTPNVSDEASYFYVLQNGVWFEYFSTLHSASQNSDNKLPYWALVCFNFHRYQNMGYYHSVHIKSIPTLPYIAPKSTITIYSVSIINVSPTSLLSFWTILPSYASNLTYPPPRRDRQANVISYVQFIRSEYSPPVTSHTRYTSLPSLYRSTSLLLSLLLSS
jgi:hypothetical protein